MLQVIPGRDPLRPAQRRIVEVSRRQDGFASLERNARVHAGIEAALRRARAEALDLVKRLEDNAWLADLVHLAPDSAVRRRDRCRINPEVEQRAGYAAAAYVGEEMLDPAPPWTL